MRPIGSQDVNAYLSEHAAPGTTAKTFRTWNATVMAAELLAEAAQADEPTKRVVTETVRAVASELGNTPTVCRTSYVHPFVIVSYLDGSLLPAWQRPAGAKPTGLTVAYHSACSMQHGQQLKDGPKRLLSAAGFKVKDVPEGHICCGSAGVYNILQPQIAGQLRDRKVDNIEKVAPDIIATGNIGCMVQIDRGQAERGITTPVVHTVELLDWATGGPMPEAIRVAGLAKAAAA